MTETLERKIKLAQIDSAQVTREIGDFIVEKVLSVGATGCVIGLSGGVDSTTTAALIKSGFDYYNTKHQDHPLELVGYILPSNTNNPKDAEDGINVAQRLGLRYEVQNIEPWIEAAKYTNPEAITSKFDKGNLMSRIRANILSTKSATEKKVLAGTGNKDEDFGIGYYTLFGDGAVHISPIGDLHKRLVRQLATYHGFDDLANRTPTAGLEPGQSDFKDLGYSYDTVELVVTGLAQGYTPDTLVTQSQVVDYVTTDMAKYETNFGHKKFTTVQEVLGDILHRNKIAQGKAEIIHPPIAPVTVKYM